MTTKDNLFTITEISEKTGVHPQTLRNWERQNLITPVRVAGNQRIYTNDHIAQIEEILKLKDEGLRLKGVLNVLTGKKTTFGKSSKPRMAVAAQTLEKTKTEPAAPKTESKPVTTYQQQEEAKEQNNEQTTQTEQVTNAPQSTAGVRRGRPKFKIAELEDMSISDLNDLAKSEGVLYFRQMLKDELITALAYPSQREAMKNQAKARTKERYGGKVYGTRAKEREAQKAEQQNQVEIQEEVQEAPQVQANNKTKKRGRKKGSSQSNQRQVTAAQKQNSAESPKLTEVKEAGNQGLVAANDKQAAKEEIDTRQKLIQDILAMGEAGKSPDEIAKVLAKQYK